MSRLQSNLQNVILFLDAVLSSHPGWQLAVERAAQSFVDPPTLALLAKAHGSRLSVIDANSSSFPPQLPIEDNNDLAPLPKIRGALVVCTSSSLNQPEALLRHLPPHAAVLVLGDEEFPTTSKRGQPLFHAGFSRVDSISVPHEAAFWMRSATRGEFSPASVANAFSSCLNNSGGMETSQYFRVVVEILRNAPCNVLVFGAGADTALYVEANARGRTVVVEHRATWRNNISDLPCELVTVEYKTKLADGLLREVGLPKGFPPELVDVAWSVILIDSPEGHTDQMPGRQQSIFAARNVSKQGSMVFVHDYDRSLESIVTHQYFGTPNEVLGKKPSLAVFAIEHLPETTTEDEIAYGGERAKSSGKETATAQPVESAVAEVSDALDVSVIIPTHNEGDWLERTVKSILAAKTALTYEVVVVDDASNDGSVDKVRDLPGVRVVSVGDKPVGCVIGRNLGAKGSRGDYICFLDSHVLVRDEWLERLRETATQYQDRVLVSGNILNVDQLEDSGVQTQQYAYTLKAWSVESAWYFHGHAKNTEPYLAPLCPAGLMFAKRSYFRDIGGFSERIKKWGGTDVEISLKNYMYGGENVVDPRVFIYHYYKNRTDRKPTFSISYEQTFFNRLFIAKTFCSEEVYKNAQAVLAKKAKIVDFVAEVESEQNQRHIHQMRKRFVRDWTDFAQQFRAELKNCFIAIDGEEG